MLQLKKYYVVQKITYLTILLMTLIWCALLISVPFLARGGQISQKVSGFITLSFSPACHQAHQCSFTFWHNHLPVCARCTGIYSGFLLGMILYPIFCRPRKYYFPSAWILLAGFGPMILEKCLSWTGIIQPNNTIRFITGCMAGCVIPYFVIPAAVDLATLLITRRILYARATE